MAEKRYIVSITRGSEDEDGAAPYRNVHKVEVIGGWLVITKNDRSTIYMSSMTVETVRVDEMRPGD
jgi:hypothetical protein